ncbi:hypothetical protein KAX17_09395 [Candidatus Bipolaricaulota bacterium]|nr:hypothetical protein [Candidatus Bipolaricaulota bacterium]
MKKAFLVLFIVGVGLLGLNMLPGRTATADSELVSGDLSKLAKDLGVVPEDTGRYSLADILEAFYVQVENTNTQVSALQSTVTKIGDTVSNLQAEVHTIRQGAVGVSLDQLNELASWTEREVTKLWNNWNRLDNLNIERRLQQIEGELRDQSGRNLDYRLSRMESRIQQIEWTLQGINSNSNDYRLQQIEWKLNDLQNQINSLRR